jgi:hypothetical protein
VHSCSGLYIGKIINGILGGGDIKEEEKGKVEMGNKKEMWEVKWAILISKWEL